MKPKKGAVPQDSTPGQRRAASDDHAARTSLIEATVSIVAENGLGAATSRKITDAAGVNLAAITYHFGSKDALVATALTAELERLVRPALERLESEGDPAENLLDAVGQLLRTFADERDRAPAYLAALLEAARSDDDATGRGTMRCLRERLAAVVGRLQDAGQVPGWVDAEAMSALIISAANGIVLQVTLEDDGPPPDAMAAQLVLLLLNARVDP